MYNRTSERYKKKRQKQRLIMLLIALLVVVAMLLLLLIRPASANLMDSLVAMPFKADDQFMPYSDGIVYLSGDTLAAINSNNEQVFSTRVGIDSPRLIVQGDTIIVYNIQSITAVSLEGTVLFTVSLDSIEYVRACATTVAAMCKDADGIQKIYVYDIQGNAITSVSTSGKMLDFGFTKDNHLWHLVLDASSVNFSCKITTYKDQGKNMNGVTVIDSQIVQQVLFSTTQICAVGTTNIISSNYVNQPLNSELIYGWEVLDCFMSEGDKAVFLMSPRSEQVGTPVYTAAKTLTLGEDPATTQLPPDCTKLLLGKDKFYAFTSAAIYEYDMDCKLLGTHDLPQSADSITKAYGSSVLVTIGTEVHLLTLP